MIELEKEFFSKLVLACNNYTDFVFKELHEDDYLSGVYFILDKLIALRNNKFSK